MAKYIPEVFVAPSPDSEALGQPMLVFSEMAHMTPLLAVLNANALGHIEADQWYPMQSALNVFKALFEDPNGPNYDLVTIGMKAMETFTFPPGANTLEDILGMLDLIA